MATTRLGQFGVGVQPYPGFVAKSDASVSPHDPGVITRLGQCGVGLARYGTFLPKGQAAVNAPIFAGAVVALRRLGLRQPQRALLVAFAAVDEWGGPLAASRGTV